MARDAIEPQPGDLCTSCWRYNRIKVEPVIVFPSGIGYCSSHWWIWLDTLPVRIRELMNELNPDIASPL